MRVYGATSATSGNWHLWTPQPFTIADTCNGTGYVAGDTTGTSPTRCLAPISFWLQRTLHGTSPSPWTSFSASAFTQGASVIPAAGTLLIRRVPYSVRRYASANGVMLNLVDNNGAPGPFPYISIEVCNMGRWTLTNIEANLWPRVQ